MTKSLSLKPDLHFQDLMLHRIHEILLIASPYDGYTLEQDGKLTEQILSEYIGMNLSYAPRVWNATSAKSAMQMLEKRSFNLIIIMMRIPDMNSFQLGQEIKSKYPGKPVVLLAFDESEVKRITNKQKKYFDEIFIWAGDSNVFPAIIKLIEDKNNVIRDVRKADVRVIILVEDTPKYYSILLPVLYKEIIYHTKHLINQSLNNTQKLLHMRARPKILLSTNYEDAIKNIKKFHSNILGIISDIRFPINQKKDSYAGIKLIKEVRKIDKSVPILFQSSHNIDLDILENYSAKFLNKKSPTLIKDLRKLIINNFGFGNFKFRLKSGKEISNASDIKELRNEIKKIPNSSLSFHASNNHLSNWLAARGEFNLASKFKILKDEDFKTIEDRRTYHIKLLNDYLNDQDSPTIADYSSYTDKTHSFIRIGNGSLGGKARGLAFANSILTDYDFKTRFPNVNIRIPKVIVITTSEFDEFMDLNNLWEASLSLNDNKKIEQKFIKSKLPKNLIKTLKSLLKKIKFPLAIRSSSLLEDSQYKPLAGMYSTLMLPNSNKKFSERFNQLSEAIKRIYASTFYREPKSLMDSVSQRAEEEKMAVIIMELVGKKHNQIYYPTLSGVCQSYNYYPVSHMERKDGVAFLALGLGKTIADGEKSLRYCPLYPEILPQYYSTKSMLNNTQNTFYALNLHNNQNPLKNGEEENLNKYNLDIAEKDKQLNYIADVIVKEDNIIRESLQYQGPRILTFSSIIKYNSFPLNDILNEFIKQGENFIGCPFEIEFAVNINKNKKSELCLLQVKPMAIDSTNYSIDIFKDMTSANSFCYSNQVLGDGISKEIRHILYINPQTFKREKTNLIAKKIEKLNKELGTEKPYLLIGPGRWGSSDPWLGIPVNWEQIANAKSIIEIGIDTLNPDPSFGSHFFQNLTSLRIGYFTINRNKYKTVIDWKWLNKQNHIYQSEYVNLVELNQPLTIKIDGVNGNGIILKEETKQENMDENESSGI
ncbi:MAG: hypothetical protein CMG66_03595 [Candidatus Marinimicrobia bacterium]|nr:hypothetical protein [Candidatus Neomarinimicrobiota bacterium]|tara:strand:+ start:2252 stop:5230 length:2979 start_codon:yes stop_codon:yes gene_type:complete